MLDCAALVRAQPASAGRTAAAERLVRTAMFKFALRQLTDDERRRIQVILEPCCPELFTASVAAQGRHAALQTLGNEADSAGLPVTESE
jgi:predicted RNA-binding Zn ribbon-like protein